MSKSTNAATDAAPAKKPRRNPAMRGGMSRAALKAARHAAEERLREIEMLERGQDPKGREPAYDPKMNAMATNLCMLGLNNEEIAHSFGVHAMTLQRWIDDVPEFRLALKAGREDADAMVARALFHSATGYEHPEDDIRTVAVGGNGGSEIVITPTTKHYPPNATSIAIWLNNRQPQRFRPRAADGAGTGGGLSDPGQIGADAQEAIRAALMIGSVQALLPSAKNAAEGDEE